MILSSPLTAVFALKSLMSETMYPGNNSLTGHIMSGMSFPFYEELRYNQVVA